MPVEYKSDYILASLMLTIFGDVAVAECFIAVKSRSKNIRGLTRMIKDFPRELDKQYSLFPAFLARIKLVQMGSVTPRPFFSTL